MAIATLAPSEANKQKAELARNPSLKLHSLTPTADITNPLHAAGNMALQRRAAGSDYLHAPSVFGGTWMGDSWGGVIQAKLTVNQPGDPYEQEADRVAEQVMRMADSGVTAGEVATGQFQNVGVQRICAECDEERHQQIPKILRMCSKCEEESHGLPPDEEKRIVQAKESSGQSPEVAAGAQGAVDAVRSDGGEPLPATVRAVFEPRFGHDFSHVRVHTDARATESARDLNALAYTVGRDVVFGAGKYSPGTTSGDRLLAHELTHVIQQSEGPVSRAEAGVGIMLGASSQVVQRTVGNDFVSVGATVLATGEAAPRAEGAGIEFESSGSDKTAGPATPGIGLTVESIAGPAEVGGPLGPAAQVPEAADVACPPYSDDERQRSFLSKGQTHDFGEGGESIDSALLFDFEPGSSEVRPKHIALLKDIVDRFKLGDPSSPIEKINDIEGFTDCVGFAAGKEASKGINASIRTQRAINVKLALMDAGATSLNIPATPHRSGEKGGPSGPGEDRALNRSVRITLERKAAPPPEIPGPEPEGPGPKLCLWGGPPSAEWELTSHVSGSRGKEGVPVGGTVTFFHLKDLNSGRRFVALFGAVSGGISALPVDIQISIPSATPFKTIDRSGGLSPVCPSDFDGPASIVTKFSITLAPPLPPIGRMEGDIILNIRTKPPGIDIGSTQIGTPAAGAGIAEGPFFVIESLPF